MAEDGEDDIAIAAPLDDDDDEIEEVSEADALLDRLTGAAAEDEDDEDDRTEDALQGIAAALLGAGDDEEDAAEEDRFDAARLDDEAEEDDSVGPLRLDRSSQVVEEATAEDEDDGEDRGVALLHDEPDEEGVARLYSRADGELSTPEAGQRREALSQLKAAVLAAEAARELGEGRSTDVSERAFRDDLDEVVRPRRPVLASEGRSSRPRQAPLKLVASQRIDIPMDEPASRSFDTMPVRPRRVAVSDSLAMSDGDGGFAEFALSMGAHELPDLLEAAAAYTSFVEGMDDFSRPQLIAKVREAAEQSYSREDELRSFGTLLRQGRLSKVRNGRFMVAESTRFHPERQAG